MTKTFTFTVVEREDAATKQTTYDVVRNDGHVSRSGLYREMAEGTAKLLNRYSAERWSKARWKREVTSMMLQAKWDHAVRVNN